MSGRSIGTSKERTPRGSCCTPPQSQQREAKSLEHLRPVVWFRTKTGKRMPVDAKTCRPTDAEHQLDLKRHTSHFATCPQADAWRKPR